MRTARLVFIAAAVLGAVGGSMFLSSRSATANGFAGPFAGGTQKDTTLSTSEKLCLDGSTCSTYLQYDGGTLGLVGAEVDVPNGFTDSQKVNPDTIITPYSVVSQAASGQAAFRVAQTGARYYFDVAGNVYCYSNGSKIICTSQLDTPAMQVDTVDSYTASRNRVEILYPQPYPFGSLPTCDSTHKGVLTTLSTDGRTYACDGTTEQRVAYSLSGSASLNFGNLTTHTSETLTVTVTGALTTDAVVCSALAQIEDDLHIQSWVSAADTVSVRAHNDSGVDLNPAAATYNCVVVR